MSQETGNLLERMLRLLNSGGLHTVDETAGRLGVSVALVSAMMDNLARRGYLVSIDSSSATGCEGCSLTGMCATSKDTAPASRLMALTAKGRLAAAGG